jgi:hypothetical protein
MMCAPVSNQSHQLRPGSAAALVLSLLCGSIPAAAAIRTVPDGYPTIQNAIDNSVSGDTVLIAPGTYTGEGNHDLDPGSRDLVITSSAGAAQTIIDCQGAGRGFRVSGEKTQVVRIEKLTILNGSAVDASGGGIYCEDVPLTIADCRILQNVAALGGGIRLERANADLLRCEIAGNRANWGAGVMAEFSGCLISGCVIIGNRSEESGGGIGLFESWLSITHCTISANSADRYGGGLFSDYGFGMSQSIVWGNCAAAGGDEIYNWMEPGDLSCCDVDSSGVGPGTRSVNYSDCVFADPGFCAPISCGLTLQGDWSLSAGSVCLPGQNPCGVRIGALDQACASPPPDGACCSASHGCALVAAVECQNRGDTYLGDDRPCLPNPCENTPVESTTWGRIKVRFRN